MQTSGLKRNAPTSGALAALVAVAGLAPLVSAAVGGDWPQWRGGPARDGVVRSGPRLLDRWPEGGPTLLWKSAPLEGVGDGGPLGNATAPVGGCGSVTIADGKAFFFVHGKTRNEQIVFTTAALRRMGWVEGMTTNLAAKVDQAYRFQLVGKPAELEAHLKEFLATLDAGDTAKFGDVIRTSLSAPWDQRVSWGLLMRLTRMRDKACASIEEWNHQSGDLLHGHAEHNGEIRSLLDANGFIWRDTVVCLDARTGKTLWQRDFPGNPLPSFTYGFLASGTPAVGGGRCYVAGSAGVYCLSAADGTVVWKAPAGFSNSSPLLTGDSVYVFVPEGLTAYDAAGGGVRWRQTNAVNAMASGSVALWPHAGRDYLIGYGRRHKGSDLLCVAADTGEVVWRLWGEDGPGYTTPAVAGDRAVAFGKGSVWAFDLAPDKGAVAWRPKDPRAPRDERGGSAVVFDGCVYVVGGGYGNSGAHCFDLATGEMKWTQPFQHTETPSPVLADGKIIAHANLEKNRSGVVMFRATPAGYEELGRLYPRDETLNFCASPVVADGRLYLRMQKCVACYDLTTASN